MWVVRYYHYIMYHLSTQSIGRRIGRLIDTIRMVRYLLSEKQGVLGCRGPIYYEVFNIDLISKSIGHRLWGGLYYVFIEYLILPTQTIGRRIYGGWIYTIINLCTLPSKVLDIALSVQIFLVDVLCIYVNLKYWTQDIEEVRYT